MNDFESAKLRKFSQAVYKEVDEQIFSILEEAAVMKEEIIESSTDEGLEIAYDRIKDQKKRIEQKYVRQISSSELENQRRVLLHRKKLEDLVFENVKYDLIRFTKTDSYKGWLKEKLKSVTFADSISVRAEDAELFKELTSIAVTTDNSIKLGGFFAHNENQGTIIDLTLDTMLGDEKEAFINRGLLKLY